MDNLLPLKNSSLVNILTLRYDPSLKPNLPRKTSNDFEINNIVPDTEFIEKTICDNIEQMKHDFKFETNIDLRIEARTS